MSLASIRRSSSPLAVVTLLTFFATLLPPLRAHAALPETNTDGGGGGSVGFTGGSETIGGSAGNAGAQGLATVGPTGAAGTSVPLELSSARGAVQPSLALSYSTAAGMGVAGYGWSVDLPKIERRGHGPAPTWTGPAPHQKFDPANHLDRYYLSGKALIPVCFVPDGNCEVHASTAAPGIHDDLLPDFARSGEWHEFRLEKDESGARIFWSPDHDQWRVQEKAGVTMELGVPSDDATDREGLDTDPAAAGQTYRWNLTRQYDAHRAGAGAAARPSNVIVYRWSHAFESVAGRPARIGLLTDIYDTPFLSHPIASSDDYAHHTKLTYENREVHNAQTPVWLRPPELRLKRVDVTSTNDPGAARQLVRRYHLEYYSPGSFGDRSFLLSVALEGQCVQPIFVPGSDGPHVTPLSPPYAEDANGALPGATNCPTLPKTLFKYDNANLATASDPVEMSGPIASFSDPGLKTPDIIDIDGNGLPDFVFRPSADECTGPQYVYFNKGGTHFVGAEIAPVVLPSQLLYSNTLSSNRGVTANWLGDGRVNLLWSGYVPPNRIPNDWFAVLTARKDWLGKKGWSWEIAEDAPGLPEIASNSAGWSFPLDANGDGLMDWYAQEPVHDTVWITETDRYGKPSYFSKKVASCNAFADSLSDVDHAYPKFAGDIDGDGLTDLVTVRSEAMWVSLNNGDGTFGGRDDSPLPRGRQCIDSADAFEHASSTCACAPPEGTTLKPRTMTGVPTMVDDVTVYEMLPKLVRLADVTGDGKADLIYLRNGNVEVYENVNGSRFNPTPRVITFPQWDGNPAKVKIADMNGSGAADIVFLWSLPSGESRVTYFDLLGGHLPSLLVAVWNGYGAETTLTYATTASLEYAAEQTSGAGAWSTSSAQSNWVVTNVSTDNGATGIDARIGTTSYAYRDPVYDARHQTFQGFREVSVTTSGTGVRPHLIKTTYLSKRCDDVSTLPPLVCPYRADEPYTMIEGVPVLVEDMDGADVATKFSTMHTSYRVVRGRNGMDGRVSRRIVPARTDTYLYDSATSVASSATGVAPAQPDQPSQLNNAVCTRVGTASASLDAGDARCSPRPTPRAAA